MNKPKFSEDLLEVITGIVYIYGPIRQEEIIETIKKYFPAFLKDYKNEDFVEATQFLHKDFQFLYLEDKKAYSIFSNEEFEETCRAFGQFCEDVRGKKKEFNDPAVFFGYRNIERFKHPVLTEIQEYFDTKQFKEGCDAKQLIQEVFHCCTKFGDLEATIETINQSIKGRIAKERLRDWFSEFADTIPHGFLNGYTIFECLEIAFEEIESKMQEAFNAIEDYQDDDRDDDRLVKKEGYKKFPSYSYAQCQSLARKLKKTHLFACIDSESPIELLINGESVFIQVLGYYYGDCNIIVYGDWDNFLYNYHYIAGQAEKFPDLRAHLKYSEIILDDSEGFLTPMIERELKKRKRPVLPLMVDIDPTQDIQLPSAQKLNQMGAILESLLIIADEFEPFELEQNTKKENPYEVVQIYLYEDHYEIGYFMDLEIEEPQIPFEVERIFWEIDIDATSEQNIQIGIFAIPVGDEIGYLTIIVNPDTEQIIHVLAKKQEEMREIQSEIYEVLEDSNILPVDIEFNNSFTEAILQDLWTAYDLDFKIENNGSYVNKVFEDMMGSLDMFDDDLLH